MRKIPPEYENPIDNIMVIIADKLNPFFKKTGHTANTLTTYSLITGLIYLYFAYHNNVILFSVFYIISYFFDCADGNFARAYKMTSKFGNKYDHIKDVVILTLFGFLMIYKFNRFIRFYHIAFVAAIMHLTQSFVGCQQQFYSSAEGEDIDTLKYLCPKKEWIVTLRYFGSGTFVYLLGSFYIYFYYLSKGK